MLPKTHQALAQDFYKNRLQLGYQPRNSRAMYHYVQEFLDWLPHPNLEDLSRLSPQKLQNYQTHLSERSAKGNPEKAALHPRTVHSYMHAVKDFFLWLENTQQWKDNPFHRFQLKYPQEALCRRTILSAKEMQLLYQTAFWGVEKALLALAYGCGLRAGEIESCNVEDFRWEEKLLIVPKGKGNKRRVLPLSPQVAQDLSAYCFEHRRRRCRGRNSFENPSAYIVYGTALPRTFWKREWKSTKCGSFWDTSIWRRRKFTPTFPRIN